MPGEQVHFSAGVAGGTIMVIASLLFRAVRKHFRMVLLFAPFFMTACGIFALMPDVLTVVFSQVHEKGFWHCPAANICFFHMWFDEWGRRTYATPDWRLHVLPKIVCYIIYNSLIVVYMFYIVYLRAYLARDGAQANKNGTS